MEKSKEAIDPIIRASVKQIYMPLSHSQCMKHCISHNVMMGREELEPIIIVAEFWLHHYHCEELCCASVMRSHKEGPH